MAGSQPASQEQSIWFTTLYVQSNRMLLVVLGVIVFVTALFGGMVKLSELHIQQSITQQLQTERKLQQSRLEQVQALARQEHARAEALRLENQRLQAALRGAG